MNEPTLTITRPGEAPRVVPVARTGRPVAAWSADNFRDLIRQVVTLAVGFTVAADATDTPAGAVLCLTLPDGTVAAYGPVFGLTADNPYLQNAMKGQS